jgi:alcohol dehydrogenase YqhD (iron-dependent ADH family)
MKDFIFHNPTKLVFGRSSMSKIKKNVKSYGLKVLLTYGGGSVKKNGIYDKVTRQLKLFEVKEFGGIEPNPRIETLQKAIDKYKSFNPDLILAVGGGSVIDGSKLLAASFHYNGDPWDFMANNPEPERYIPLATVLTLAATGSEMNGAAVISRWKTREKLHFIRDEVLPKFSILDPRNTFTVPKDQTAYGIIDAFSHVLEQYINTTKNIPLQDKLCESVLLTLIENVPKVMENPRNYNARANIMFSATMALNGVIALGVDEDWATHMIEHQISAFYDIPHAAGLAIITPRWMKVVRDQKKLKLVQYGKRIWGIKGNDRETIEGAIEKTYNFFKSLGIKMSLTEWNITSKHFDTMIDRLVKMKIGEVPLRRAQIRKILEESIK